MFARRLLIGLVRGYQLLLSSLIGPSCRFLPTCSDYAIEALTRHGCWCGAVLILRRLARCHPWATAGLDPVPERVDLCRCCRAVARPLVP